MGGQTWTPAAFTVHTRGCGGTTNGEAGGGDVLEIGSWQLVGGWVVGGCWQVGWWVVRAYPRGRGRGLPACLWWGAAAGGTYSTYNAYLGLEDGQRVEQLVGDQDELLLRAGERLPVDAVLVAGTGRGLVAGRSRDG